MMTQVISVILLILLNAFFAGSEMAFISLNMNKIKAQAQEGDKKSQMIVSLMEDQNNFLSSIQVGVTLSGFLASAFASEAFATLLADFIVGLGLSVSVELIKAMSMLIITIILSYLTILFGELVPKRIALTHADRFANLVIYPIHYFSFLFQPLVKLLSFSVDLVLRLVGIDPNDSNDGATEEEIRLLVDVGQESGHIDESERDMINNIFEFDNQEVQEIMTHRTEIIAIDDSLSIKEIIDLVNNERFTRYPVYKSNIDNIIGTIHIRDLLQYDYNKDLKLESIMRKPHFVPDSKKINELFNDLKVNKNHIAIVVDEYGGTAGIATMEDLIEEVMGNIFDEYDEDEDSEILKINDEMYLVEGQTDLDDLEEELMVELPVDEFDTLSGFIIGQLGRLPEASDVNSLKSAIIFNNYRFIIIQIEDKVIKKVKILKLTPDDEDYQQEEEHETSK